MKELHAEIKALVQQGWIYEHGRKHGKLKHPAGFPKVVFSRTPSDWRALENFKREIRLAGRRTQEGPVAHVLREASPRSRAPVSPCS